MRGLYAITSEAICAETSLLLRSVEAALRGGAAWIQYRDKKSDAARQRKNAQSLLTLCHQHGARLIINDNADLAADIGANGVHLGRSDGSIAAARKQLGASAIIGASCGNSLETARSAVAEGVSYVAFGRLFSSRTKPSAPPADLELLMQARTLGVAVCGIGGITPANGASVIAAGADLVAAVEGVFGAADIEAAARAYTKLFE
ncbi:MAG: thiamine phosphate synthase [Pseudomonadota bacterium]